MLKLSWYRCLPPCPNCKAAVPEPDRVYKVTVEPEKGERGIMQRDVGMYRCQRCDMTFPRVISKKHYLLVPETELTRLTKENELLTKKAATLEANIEAIKKENTEHQDSLRAELRENLIASLESELGQVEKHVKYLSTERDRLKKEIAEE
jgi:septal ring factor EnvC (AmiA/AmiB activator)